MPRLFRLVALLGLVTACSGDDEHTPPPIPGPVVYIEIRPENPIIDRGAQVQLTTVLYDSASRIVTGPTVAWTSSDPAIAEVTPDGGLVTGILNGQVIITATAAGITGEKPVLVSSGQPVASVSVVPGSRLVLAGSVIALEATPRDAAGQPILADLNVTWVSDNAETAAFDDGLGPVHGSFVYVTFGSDGVGGITAFVDLARNALDYPIRHAAWASVSAARFFSCGVTPNREAYCWGNGDGGHLGTGVYTPEQVPTRVAGPVRFSAVSGGSATTCGLSDGAAYCWGRVGGLAYNDPLLPDVALPTAVAGLPPLSAIAVGEEFACALAVGGAAWCWGVNRNGQLGSGNIVWSGTPATVVGAHQFTALSAGRAHTCAITAAGAAWCWGSDFHGQLGDAATSNCTSISPTDECSSTPVAVAGAPALVAISAGGDHSCGLAADGAAWCWGGNAAGQLGNGTTAAKQLTAVPVSGGLQFSAIAAGDGFTCALTAVGEAWCWGNNDLNQLGTDGGPSRSSPVAVSTIERFTSLDAGDNHTCAVTTFGIGWCWGENALFELGSGRPTFVKVPIRLPG